MSSRPPSLPFQIDALYTVEQHLQRIIFVYDKMRRKHGECRSDTVQLTGIPYFIHIAPIL